MPNDVINITYKTEGFKELEDVLIQMSEDIGYDKGSRRVLTPALRAAAQPVLQKAIMQAPYDPTNNKTKHLKDSFKIATRKPSARDMSSVHGSKTDVAIATVGARTDKRAISQEFGNHRVSPQPYLRSALESQWQTVVQIFGSYLSYKLQQYTSKKVKKS